MSVATGSLTINAAFLREIKEDNRELRQLLHEVQTRFQNWAIRTPESMTEIKKADDLLTALRDQLAIHFSLEESFGYFENAVETAPRLSNQAFTLRAEHGVLFQRICAVVEQAERLLYNEHPAGGFPRLANAWKSFHEDFHRHEERERELILSAFDEDLGGSD